MFRTKYYHLYHKHSHFFYRDVYKRQGETHKAIKYQRRLDKIDNERDITEILQLKKEIDSLLQEYKNKVDD